MFKFIPFEHRKVHVLQNTPSVCVHDHVDVKSVASLQNITGIPDRYIVFPDHIMNLLENNLEKLLLPFLPAINFAISSFMNNWL